jgi:N utilization substance protein B
VVINESVELAKEYSTEKSPLFVNGVLDKLYRQFIEAGVTPAPGEPLPPLEEDAPTDAPQEAC